MMKGRRDPGVLGIVVVAEDFGVFDVLVAVPSFHQLSIRDENSFSEIDMGIVDQDYSPRDFSIILGEAFVSDIPAINYPMAFEKTINDVKISPDCHAISPQ